MTKTVKKKKFVKHIWTLADGTEIHTSPLGAAQLRGVTTGGHISRNFIAYLSPDWVPDNLKHLLNAPNSLMHHMGCYTTASAAAAVSALAQDPELMEFMLSNYQSHGCTPDCPNRYPETELCESHLDIPERVTNSEVAAHKTQLATARTARGRVVKVLLEAEVAEREAAEEAAVIAASKFELNSDTASEIRKNIMEIYGMNFFFGLDVIAKSAIRTLTWEEWKKEHGGDV